MSDELRFPDPMDVSRQRAEEFQRLSPEARFREMAAMMAFGWRMIKSSPDREALERRMGAQEEDWRRTQRELMDQHGE